jgi:hypothetical protein
VDSELSPIWALSKTTLNSDVLVVPIEQWVDTPEGYGPYKDRPHSRLLWRGSNTGMYHANKEPWIGWRKSHRVRLVEKTSAVAAEGDVDVLPPPTKSGSLAMNLQHAPRRTVNAQYMNVAFVGKPSRKVVQSPGDVIRADSQMTCRVRQGGWHLRAACE